MQKSFRLEEQPVRFQLNSPNQNFQDTPMCKEPNGQYMLPNISLTPLPQCMFKHKKPKLKKNQLDSLQNRLDSLKEFIKEIGNLNSQPLRPDILQYCSNSSILIQQITSKEAIIQIADNRVTKMIKNGSIKRNWGEEDINLLVWILSKYCQFNKIQNVNQNMSDPDWENIANYISGATGRNCMFKWLALKKNNVTENNRSDSQQLLLGQVFDQIGDDWNLLSEELYLKNNPTNKIYRTAKQCRQHWFYYLNPKILKGFWTQDQDYLLVKAVMQLGGLKRWAQIMKILNGRTQNAIKNRFNLIIQKQLDLLENKKYISQLQVIDSYLKKKEHSLGFKEENIANQLQQLKNKVAKKKPKLMKNRKTKKQSYSVVTLTTINQVPPSYQVPQNLPNQQRLLRFNTNFQLNSQYSLIKQSNLQSQSNNFTEIIPNSEIKISQKALKVDFNERFSLKNDKRRVNLKKSNRISGSDNFTDTPSLLLVPFAQEIDHDAEQNSFIVVKPARKSKDTKILQQQ